MLISLLPITRLARLKKHAFRFMYTIVGNRFMARNNIFAFCMLCSHATVIIWILLTIFWSAGPILSNSSIIVSQRLLLTSACFTLLSFVHTGLFVIVSSLIFYDFRVGTIRWTWKTRCFDFLSYSFMVVKNLYILAALVMIMHKPYFMGAAAFAICSLISVSLHDLLLSVMHSHGMFFTFGIRFVHLKILDAIYYIFVADIAFFLYSLFAMPIGNAVSVGLFNLSIALLNIFIICYLYTISLRYRFVLLQMIASVAMLLFASSTLICITLPQVVSGDLVFMIAFPLGLALILFLIVIDTHKVSRITTSINNISVGVFLRSGRQLLPQSLLYYLFELSLQISKAELYHRSIVYLTFLIYCFNPSYGIKYYQSNRIRNQAAIVTPGDSNFILAPISDMQVLQLIISILHFASVECDAPMLGELNKFIVVFVASILTKAVDCRSSSILRHELSASAPSRASCKIMHRRTHSNCQVYRSVFFNEGKFRKRSASYCSPYVVGTSPPIASQSLLMQHRAEQTSIGEKHPQRKAFEQKHLPASCLPSHTKGTALSACGILEENISSPTKSTPRKLNSMIFESKQEWAGSDHRMLGISTDIWSEMESEKPLHSNEPNPSFSSLARGKLPPDPQFMEKKAVPLFPESITSQDYSKTGYSDLSAVPEFSAWKKSLVWLTGSHFLHVLNAATNPIISLSLQYLLYHVNGLVFESFSVAQFDSFLAALLGLVRARCTCTMSLLLQLLSLQRREAGTRIPRRKWHVESTSLLLRRIKRPSNTPLKKGNPLLSQESSLVDASESVSNIMVNSHKLEEQAFSRKSHRGSSLSGTDDSLLPSPENTIRSMELETKESVKKTSVFRIDKALAKLPKLIARKRINAGIEPLLMDTSKSSLRPGKPYSPINQDITDEALDIGSQVLTSNYISRFFFPEFRDADFKRASYLLRHNSRMFYDSIRVTFLKTWSDSRLAYFMRSPALRPVSIAATLRINDYISTIKNIVCQYIFNIIRISKINEQIRFLTKAHVYDIQTLALLSVQQTELRSSLFKYTWKIFLEYPDCLAASHTLAYVYHEIIDPQWPVNQLCLSPFIMHLYTVLSHEKLGITKQAATPLRHDETHSINQLEDGASQSALGGHDEYFRPDDLFGHPQRLLVGTPRTQRNILNPLNKQFDDSDISHAIRYSVLKLAASNPAFSTYVTYFDAETLIVLPPPEQHIHYEVVRQRRHNDAGKYLPMLRALFHCNFHDIFSDQLCLYARHLSHWELRRASQRFGALRHQLFPRTMDTTAFATRALSTKRSQTFPSTEPHYVTASASTKPQARVSPSTRPPSAHSMRTYPLVSISFVSVIDCYTFSNSAAKAFYTTIGTERSHLWLSKRSIVFIVSYILFATVSIFVIIVTLAMLFDINTAYEQVERHNGKLCAAYTIIRRTIGNIYSTYVIDKQIEDYDIELLVNSSLVYSFANSSHALFESFSELSQKIPSLSLGIWSFSPAKYIGNYIVSRALPAGLLSVSMWPDVSDPLYICSSSWLPEYISYEGPAKYKVIAEAASCLETVIVETYNSIESNIVPFAFASTINMLQAARWVDSIRTYAYRVIMVCLIVLSVCILLLLIRMFLGVSRIERLNSYLINLMVLTGVIKSERMAVTFRNLKLNSSTQRSGSIRNLFKRKDHVDYSIFEEKQNMTFLDELVPLNDKPMYSGTLLTKKPLTAKNSIARNSFNIVEQLSTRAQLLSKGSSPIKGRRLSMQVLPYLFDEHFTRPVSHSIHNLPERSALPSFKNNSIDATHFIAKKRQALKYSGTVASTPTTPELKERLIVRSNLEVLPDQSVLRLRADSLQGMGTPRTVSVHDSERQVSSASRFRNSRSNNIISHVRHQHAIHQKSRTRNSHNEMINMLYDRRVKEYKLHRSMAINGLTITFLHLSVFLATVVSSIISLYFVYAPSDELVPSMNILYEDLISNNVYNFNRYSSILANRQDHFPPFSGLGDAKTTSSSHFFTSYRGADTWHILLTDTVVGFFNDEALATELMNSMRVGSDSSSFDVPYFDSHYQKQNNTHFCGQVAIDRPYNLVHRVNHLNTFNFPSSYYKHALVSYVLPESEHALDAMYKEVFNMQSNLVTMFSVHGQKLLDKNWLYMLPHSITAFYSNEYVTRKLAVAETATTNRLLSKFIHPRSFPVLPAAHYSAASPPRLDSFRPTVEIAAKITQLLEANDRLTNALNDISIKRFPILLVSFIVFLLSGILVAVFIIYCQRLHHSYQGTILQYSDFKLSRAISIAILCMACIGFVVIMVPLVYQIRIIRISTEPIRESQAQMGLLAQLILAFTPSYLHSVDFLSVDVDALYKALRDSLIGHAESPLDTLIDCHDVYSALQDSFILTGNVSWDDLVSQFVGTPQFDEIVDIMKRIRHAVFTTAITYVRLACPYSGVFVDERLDALFNFSSIFGSRSIAVNVSPVVSNAHRSWRQETEPYVFPYFTYDVIRSMNKSELLQYALALRDNIFVIQEFTRDLHELVFSNIVSLGQLKQSKVHQIYTNIQAYTRITFIMLNVFSLVCAILIVLIHISRNVDRLSIFKIEDLRASALWINFRQAIIILAVLSASFFTIFFIFQRFIRMHRSFYPNILALRTVNSALLLSENEVNANLSLSEMSTLLSTRRLLYTFGRMSSELLPGNLCFDLYNDGFTGFFDCASGASLNLDIIRYPGRDMFFPFVDGLTLLSDSSAFISPSERPAGSNLVQTVNLKDFLLETYSAHAQLTSDTLCMLYESPSIVSAEGLSFEIINPMFVNINTTIVCSILGNFNNTCGFRERATNWLIASVVHFCALIVVCMIFTLFYVTSKLSSISSMIHMIPTTLIPSYREFAALISEEFTDILDIARDRYM